MRRKPLNIQQSFSFTGFVVVFLSHSHFCFCQLFMSFVCRLIYYYCFYSFPPEKITLFFYSLSQNRTIFRYFFKVLSRFYAAKHDKRFSRLTMMNWMKKKILLKWNIIFAIKPVKIQILLTTFKRLLRRKNRVYERFLFLLILLAFGAFFCIFFSLMRGELSNVSIEIVQGDKSSIACNYKHNLYYREHYHELDRYKFQQPEGKSFNKMHSPIQILFYNLYISSVEYKSILNSSLKFKKKNCINIWNKIWPLKYLLRKKFSASKFCKN